MSRVVMECDLLHPVGEVIFNALSTFDPNEQWPGTTWIRLKACGLFGVDENDLKYSNPGTYVGENEHVLTIEEIPSHNHDILWGNGKGFYFARAMSSDNPDENTNITPDTVKKTGGNQPHNNVQRSYLGYYWLRTA